MYDYDVYPDQEFHGDFEINGSVPVPNPFEGQLQQAQVQQQPLFFAEGGVANVVIPRRDFGLIMKENIYLMKMRRILVQTVTMVRWLLITVT